LLTQDQLDRILAEVGHIHKDLDTIREDLDRLTARDNT